MHQKHDIFAHNRQRNTKMPKIDSYGEKRVVLISGFFTLWCDDHYTRTAGITKV